MSDSSTDDGNFRDQQPPTRSRPGTIPIANECEWTNLPGWVTSYLHKQVRPTPKTNANAFEALLKLMEVPEAFWKRVKGRTVFVITHHTSLEIDLENVIKFLSWNANAGDVRMSELAEVGQVKASDWLVFPASTLRELQDRAKETDGELQAAFEQLRRPAGGFCRMAVIGSWEDALVSMSGAARRRVMNVEKVRFVELWSQGSLITYTSQAAMDHPRQLEALLGRLQDLAFDADDPEMERQAPIIPWMDLVTFHVLNPNNLHVNAWEPFLARIRAIELIGRYQGWPKALINSRSAPRTSKPSNLAQHLCTDHFPNPMTFRQTWEASKHWSEDGIEDDLSTELKTLQKEELRTLQRESQRLGDQSWALRTTLVIVSNREQRRGTSSASCRLLTFDQLDQLLKLMDDK